MKILTIALIILSINLSGQLSGKVKIDSLLKELPKAKSDTNHVILLKELSFAYYPINQDKGIKYGEQGLKLANNINWKAGASDCYNSLAVNNVFKFNYSKALEHWSKALKINQELGDKQKVAFNLGNMGHYI